MGESSSATTRFLVAAEHAPLQLRAPTMNTAELAFFFLKVVLSILGRLVNEQGRGSFAEEFFVVARRVQIVFICKF
jgi:hypothetical protein